MSAHAVDRYLADCSSRRNTQALTPETSLYPPLEALLASAGGGLKPRVHCFMSLKNFDGNMPDGGLFTGDQLLKGELKADQIPPPSRGVIECKPPTDDVLAIADSKQALRYSTRFNQVLVTNYREFALIAKNETGKPARLEYYRLAATADEFWALAADRKAAVAEHGDRLLDFLKRCLCRPAPLSDPKDLAWFLASYAREARHRLEAHSTLPRLLSVRTALEDALGLHIADAAGEHFFQSTLVQTLFYGLFAAWVLWHEQGEQETFDWEKASKYLHVPILRKLFRELTDPRDLHDLKLSEVMRWAADVLNRVERDKFFAKFKDAEAVQYFYEPFLEAFDPELRKQLGVWYTPPEIVKYMVGRVHQVLISDFNRPDGLADPGVVVLDPCCGTGAYLVEVLNTVAEVLKEKGEEGILGGLVKKAATERVFGFEILPAPFAIAHLQLGLLLQRLGAPLDEAEHERAKVFLTNALTGWSVDEPRKVTPTFPEMSEERDAADAVKQSTPILVVIGNPPYNAYAGVSPDEEADILLPYKDGLIRKWGIKKFNLDDLYTRFFRIADRCIVNGERSRGIVCFISNFSYLSEPSFVEMRKQLVEGFNSIWIDCLNGDSRETGKLTPDGKPDPSVFSTESNREGIRLGTTIGLFARTGNAGTASIVRYREFWGMKKREELLASLQSKRLPKLYQKIKPREPNRFLLVPSRMSEAYSSWPRVVDLCAVPPSNGLMEKRGGALFDIDREALIKRMKSYLSATLEWSAYKALGLGLTELRARFEPHKARGRVVAEEGFLPERIVQYLVRPYDSRWCYYTGVRPVWNEPRPFLWNQCWPGNSFFITRPAGVASPEGIPASWTRMLGDNDYQRGHSYYFPLQLRNGARLSKKGHASLFDAIEEAPEHDVPVANLSKPAREFLQQIGADDPDSDVLSAGVLWMHALAICHSPSYVRDNSGGLREEWPRIPLPATREALLASAALGRQVAALLDSEAPVPGVTAGKLSAAMKAIAKDTKVGGGSLNGPDLDVTARWAIAGKGGITMPSTGKTVERPFTEDERAALGDLAHLGPDTFDVYLNEKAYWKNVPRAVWEYALGGYQVLKKWLSYREKSILGRGLRIEEVAHVRDTARRIAALLLLGPQLDANYAAVAAAPYAWPRASL